MKKLQLLLFFLPFLSNISAQQTYLQTYGQVQTDLNRSQELVQLNDTTFVVGGDWNGIGYMMRVNHTGVLQDIFYLDNVISGNSRVLDLTLDAAGNIIATGECDHCVPADTLKKAFAVTTEPSLLLVNSKIFEGSTPDNNLNYNASIARKGNQFVIASSVGGPGFNYEDVALTAITANLDTLWRKIYNSCGNCGFDYMVDIAPTNSGYALLVLNAFTDSLTLLHVNDSGVLIWKKRHPWATGESFFKLAYRNGTIYACGSAQIAGANPAHTGGFIRRYSDANGNLLGSMSLDAAGINDEVADLHFSSEGTLLAAHRRAEPNGFGAYQVSRIYRLNAANSTVIDFTEIPNPDVLTNMGATGVVPMNADGSEFAACGIRGFYDRTFFFSKNSLEPEPPGEFFGVSTDTACAPATLVLTNNFPGAASYSWFLNGVLFSNEEHPDPLMIPAGGAYEIELETEFGTQNNIDDFIVTSLPEIWNECAFCDNQPDPYVKIRNGAGVLVYTTTPIEDYPPVELPVNLTMNVNDTYEFEIWDSDNVGSDDFFGVFNIPGNTTGGTFSLTHPDDPTPLTITFATHLNTTTQSFSRNVVIYQPSISLQAGDVLTANPGNPTPESYTWQWFLDGQPIPGATEATFTPGVGGSYAVALVTPDCMALSNSITVSPALSIDIQAVSPTCAGDDNGSILVTPIGGTPPYAYNWNFPVLTGNNPTELYGGIYQVTVTDALGATTSAEIELIDPDDWGIALSGTDPSCHDSTDGSVLVTPVGGVPPYSYEWTPAGPSGNNPTGLEAGAYAVVATDSLGCMQAGGKILMAPPALTTVMSSTWEVATTSILGTATVDAAGGTPPYSYLWNTEPEQTTATATDLQGWKFYTVTVTDVNGCDMVDSVYVDILIATGEADAHELKMYPNPSTGFVFLEMDVQEAAKLEIFDLAGKAVLEAEVRGYPTKIDLSGLPGSVYLVTVTTRRGVFSGKVAIQR